MYLEFQGKLFELRLQYQACIRLADATDSKAEDKVLREDAAKILKELKEECLHEFTVQTAAYYPSYSSYEDPDPLEHLCLICDSTGPEAERTLHRLPKPVAYLNCGYQHDKSTPEFVRTPLKYGLAELAEQVDAYRRDQK